MPGAPLPAWRAWAEDDLLANRAYGRVLAAGRRVPALVRPAARVVAGRRQRAHLHRRVAPGLHRRAAVPLRGDGVRRAARGARPAPARAGRRRRSAATGGSRCRSRCGWPRPTTSRCRPPTVATPATSPCTPHPGVPTRRPTSPRWSGWPPRSAGGRTGASCTGSTRRTCAARYPLFDDFVALRDRLDPTGVFANDHLDRVLGPAPGAAGSAHGTHG